MKRRMEVSVYGKVQGVFFRDYVRKKAVELGIAGYAENKGSGGVHIIAEGEETMLNILADRLWEAGGDAEVIDVSTSFGDAKGDMTGFSVR
jgi:acylphosphatase